MWNYRLSSQEKAAPPAMQFLPVVLDFSQSAVQTPILLPFDFIRFRQGQSEKQIQEMLRETVRETERDRERQRDREREGEE